MKFTYSWLKDNLDTNASPSEIADKLTSLGLEVEEFTDLGKKYEPFVIAEIKEAEKHPNADKLRVCKVNNGKEELQIVCGAPNARAGIKVILAPVGALIPNGNFQIKKSKIRDVESNGMLCSAEELELGTDSEGIVELPADAPVGGKYADYAKLNDSLYEIAITPNRADCLGVFGVARDLAASGIGKLIPLNETKIQHKGTSPIKVSSPDYYIGCYVKNAKNGESCETNKQMLKSIGQTPISHLVDTTNISTFELGRPLHVYDADKIKGNITVRDAKKGEKLNALNNKSYEMQGGELVVADDSGIIALAGVIGNVETSVTAETKNVFLEVALFNPVKVAESGRRHMIDSDARYRFERGLDPEFLQTGADLALACIGGEPSEYVVVGKAPAKREIAYDYEKIKSLAGVDIPKADAEKILTALGFVISGSKVTIPSWRADVEGTADLAEEVLRVHGYDKAAAQILPFAPFKELPAYASNRNTAREVLSARGFTETVNYSFTEPKLAASFAEGNATVALLNPISADLSEMRPSIVPSLLLAANKNLNRGFKNISLFEIGPVFNTKGESIAVAGIITGQTSNKNWYEKPRSVDAFDAKAAITAVLESLNIKDPQVKIGAASYYHPGRSGTIQFGKNILGYFGELHPATVKTSGYEGNVVGFEVFLDNLPDMKRKYKKLEISDLQAVSRDFAFVVDRTVSSDDVVANIKKTNPLIGQAYVFDVYEGDKLQSGKKSLAVTVHIQPKDKTLTDAEIESISNNIVDSIGKKFGASLRK